jgi:putative ABC transport system permease protein
MMNPRKIQTGFCRSSFIIHHSSFISMNLFQLVIKQMRQRALGTWLTLLSVTLGVGLAITILILYREAGSLFGQTDYGCDVLLGKPGSGTQLVMNTIYHIDVSPGNLPYTVYEEMLDPRRLPRIAVPIVVSSSADAKWKITATTTNLFGVDEQTQKPLADAEYLAYSSKDRYQLAQGKCFAPNRFEAVIGSGAAQNGLKIGDQIPLFDGTEKWTVVGILKPSFTVLDDEVCIPLKSYFAVPSIGQKMRDDWENQFPTEESEKSTTQSTSPPRPTYQTNADGTFTLLVPDNMLQIDVILAKSRGGSQQLIKLNNRKTLAVVNPTDVVTNANLPLGKPDFGFDAVFGPPGDEVKLIKSCVYGIGKPAGRISYTVYLDMLAGFQTLPPEGVSQSMSTMAAKKTAAPAASSATQPADSGDEKKQPSMNFYSYAKVTVPIAVGDTYQGRYRIIATTTNLFGYDDVTGEKLDADHTMGYRPDKFYEFDQGTCFAPDKFEAILGSDVALKSDLKLGSEFQATHGETLPKDNPDIHPEKWKVVGVLKKTNTANDGCIFIPLKTDYTIGDHERGEKVQWALQHGGKEPPADVEPDEIRAYRKRKDGTFELFAPRAIWELSALMIKARGDPQQLIYATNNRNEAQAVNPASVMRQFFDTFLKGPTLLLLVVAFLVSVVAAVGILVSIYNSVSARMREIAIMRALGATRGRVLVLICVEAGLIGAFGSILGLIGGHLMGAVASILFNHFLGEGINWVRIDLYEVYYLLSVVVVALLAGLVPASKAYQTPVATNLVAV